MTTVKEVALVRAEESVASSKRRPLIMTPSMEEAEENAKIIDLHDCLSTNTILVCSEESAPKFLERPETMVCKEDETIKVSSKCQGEPRPIVTWFRDGKLIKEDGTCRLYSKKDEYFMEIPGCSIMDSGEYTCTATNSQGAVFCSFNIHVEAVISEHDTTPSDYSDDMMFIAHDLSAVEEEHSTDVQSDKEGHFLSRMYVVRDFHDSVKGVSFKYGELVEVLDTQRDDKWLVRKKADSLQVVYLPRSYLAQSLADGQALSVGETAASPVGSPKVSRQKRQGLRKSSSLRKGSELDSSSGEEADNDSGKESSSSSAGFVAVADYESAEIKVREGQFLEVLDQSNPHMWLVKTKPTKVNPSRVGWMPASYLEEKDGEGLVDRRNTREVFREDIIQITDKAAEAKVKRKYALGDLIEAEKDYITDLAELIEQLDAEDPVQFKNQASIASELRDLAEFHKGLFMPELVNCLSCPADAANAFMKWQQWFESYVDYCSHRIVTEVADSKYDGTRQAKLKYFAKPISQLKRYESLLKDFIRYTTRAGEDCASLEKTLNMLMSIIKAIDDQQILNNIYGAPEDLRLLGNILRHDAVTVWDNEPEKGKDKLRHVFLFPTDVVMTKPGKVGSAEHFEYKSKYSLPKVKVYCSPADSSEGDRRFEIFHISDEGVVEQFIIQCKNEYAKDAWLRNIADAMATAGISDYQLTESGYNDLVQQRKSQATSQPTKKKLSPHSQENKDENATTSAAETDLYQTAAETDGSAYFTALDSEADTGQKSEEDAFSTKRPKEDSSKNQSENLQQLAPKFTKDLEERLVVLKGSTLKLTVAVEGNPPPAVKWLKENREIKKGNIKLSQEGNEHTARIDSLAWNNAGKYKVIAENSQGKAESNCYLKVTSKASEVTGVSTEDVDKPKEEVKEKGSKPVFTQQVVHEVSDDGKSVRFDCKISSQPEADVKWMHNYRPLPTRGNKYSFLFIDDETYTLIVNELSVLDAGEYTVMAVNKHGSSESMLNLKTGDIRRPKPKKKVEQPKTNEKQELDGKTSHKPIDDSFQTEEIALSEVQNIPERGRSPSISTESEQVKSTEVIEENMTMIAPGEHTVEQISSVSVEHDTSKTTELVEERIPINNVEEDVRRPSVSVELEESKSTNFVEEQIAMSEAEEKPGSRRASVVTQLEQSMSTEVIEERLAINQTGDQKDSKRPSMTVEPDKDIATICENGVELLGEETSTVKQMASNDQSLNETSQEFATVEEINASDGKIEQPPLRRLVSINSIDIEETISKSTLESNQDSISTRMPKGQLTERDGRAKGSDLPNITDESTSPVAHLNDGIAVKTDNSLKEATSSLNDSQLNFGTRPSDSPIEDTVTPLQNNLCTSLMIDCVRDNFNLKSDSANKQDAADFATCTDSLVAPSSELTNSQLSENIRNSKLYKEASEHTIKLSKVPQCKSQLKNAQHVCVNLRVCFLLQYNTRIIHPFLPLFVVNLLAKEKC
ncbi:obscurin-like [Watersipora subatra]|uniref:obscurin-like n=1 Tax=Watersipora subatra TaxID=2589382 RepID=UPI00355C093F